MPISAKQLTAEQVAKHIAYDSESGSFTWLTTNFEGSARGGKPRRAIGAPAGHVDRDGYLRINLFRVTIMTHRLAWLLTTGKWPKNQIDHINGNKSDNRLANLREATVAQNVYNRGAPRTSLNGIKGVRFSKRRTTSRGSYVVRITRDYKLLHIGAFSSLDEAKAAYKRAAEEFHGEFANTGTSS